MPISSIEQKEGFQNKGLAVLNVYLNQQERNHEKILDEAKPVVGHNLPPFIEIG